MQSKHGFSLRVIAFSVLVFFANAQVSPVWAADHASGSEVAATAQLSGDKGNPSSPFTVSDVLMGIFMVGFGVAGLGAMGLIGWNAASFSAIGLGVDAMGVAAIGGIACQTVDKTMDKNTCSTPLSSDSRVAGASEKSLPPESSGHLVQNKEAAEAGVVTPAF